MSDHKHPILIRFWEKVSVTPNGCWEWSASTNAENGYGMFWNGERTQVAHRFLYETIIGSVPVGFELDHLCRNKRCVNPTHLDIVTRSQNTARGLGPSLAREHQLAKTHCPQGHPYNTENTYVRPNGSRICRICSNESHKRWRQKCKAR